MSGTVIDVQVFTREGIERDKRAQQIIDDELKRYKKTWPTRCASSKRDTFERIERCCRARPPTAGRKSWPKGTKLTKAYLAESSATTGSTSALANDEAAASWRA